MEQGACGIWPANAEGFSRARPRGHASGVPRAGEQLVPRQRHRRVGCGCRGAPDTSSGACPDPAAYTCHRIHLLQLVGTLLERSFEEGLSESHRSARPGAMTPARGISLALLLATIWRAAAWPGRPAPWLAGGAGAAALRGVPARPPVAGVQFYGAPAADEAACFEEDCRSSPFIMHASRSFNTSGGGAASCFKFVAIGCWAAPKGCCPAVARRFSALEFPISERPAHACACARMRARAAACAVLRTPRADDAGPSNSGACTRSALPPSAPPPPPTRPRLRRRQRRGRHRERPGPPGLRV